MKHHQEALQFSLAVGCHLRQALSQQARDPAMCGHDAYVKRIRHALKEGANAARGRVALSPGRTTEQTLVASYDMIYII